VAKPSDNDNRTLDENIKFACAEVDCRVVLVHCPCFCKDKYLFASIVMNLYYQEKGRISINCDFKNSAIVISKDPSKM
jgi:hypothetical protein